MLGISWAFIILAGLAPFIGQHLSFLGDSYLVIGPILAFAAIHGMARYGWRATAMFLAIAFVVGNIFEDLSITTGFPYGFYTHQPMSGPRIFYVPIIVGLSHTAAAYIAWSVGNVILGRADADAGKVVPFAIAIVGAFVVTGWDATGDPSAATIVRAFVYPHGGGYFGSPLSNFVGWLIAGFSYTLLAGLSFRREPVRPQPLSWSLQPLALLILLALPPMLALGLADQVVQDPSGREWHTRDMFDTETVAAIIGIVFAAVTGFLVTLRGPRESIG